MRLRQVDESYVRARRSGAGAALLLAAGALLLGAWLSGTGATAPRPVKPTAVTGGATTIPEAGRLIDTVFCAPRKPGKANEVAIIDFKGPIGDNFDTGAVYGLINGITGNAKVGAVALRVDSSGGDSYVSKKLFETLSKVKQGCGLPMAAFIGNVGTSGGYWMSLAADEIHADRLSTVGGVGVMAVFANEAEKDARDGIHYQVVRTGERKWPMIPYLPVRSEDVGKIRESLDVVLEEFVAAVESSRRGKLRLKREDLTTGEAWMGRDAERLGLVEPPAELGEVMTRLLGTAPAAYHQHDLAKALRTATEESDAGGIARAERRTRSDKG